MGPQKSWIYIYGGADVCLCRLDEVCSIYLKLSTYKVAV